MDAVTVIKERRSVRNFQNEKVNRELMKEIVELSSWAPSWANSQSVRYSLINDESTIKSLVKTVLLGYNKEKFEGAKGIAVMSYVKGQSGAINGKYLSSEGENWGIFDAGIAAQTFCLSAYAKGIATCIIGGADNNKIGEVIDLPKNEIAVALIAYGYEAGEHAHTSSRKPVEEIMRFI